MTGLSKYLQLDTTRSRAAHPHALRGLHEVARRCPVDVGHVALRVSVEHGEPAALHLHHDSVSLPERVQHVLETKLYRRDFPRRHWLGRRERVSKPGAHDLAAHELLVPAHVDALVRLIRAVRLVV